MTKKQYKCTKVATLDAMEYPMKKALFKFARRRSEGAAKRRQAQSEPFTDVMADNILDGLP